MKYWKLTKSENKDLNIVSLCSVFTYVWYFLLPLQRHDDACVWVPEAELFNPVGEVVVRHVHEARHVGVGTSDGQHLAGSHVKVAGNFVESERAVNSAGILSSVWLDPPLGQV